MAKITKIEKIKRDIDRLRYDKKLLKRELSEEKERKRKIDDSKQRVIGKKFRKDNELLLRIFDLAVITIFILNMGALATTNALVVRDNPDLQLMEANEITAKQHDLKKHPQGNIVMTQFMFVFTFWSILMYVYVFNRMKVFDERGLKALLFILIFYLIALGFDFINDFGYFIGFKIWG